MPASRVGGSLTSTWAYQAGKVPHSSVTSIKFLECQNFVLVKWCGTFPALAAQAGIRLPPTLEADKPGFDNPLEKLSISCIICSTVPPKQPNFAAPVTTQRLSCHRTIHQKNPSITNVQNESTKNIRRQECANTYKEITELMTL